jgi:hypothetical protein
VLVACLHSYSDLPDQSVSVHNHYYIVIIQLAIAYFTGSVHHGRAPCTAENKCLSYNEFSEQNTRNAEKCFMIIWTVHVR